MGIDSMRVGGGRCSIVVGGLLIICLMLVCNWWTLSSENLELAQQIDVLNEQLKISTEERDQCIVLRSNLVEKYKRTEDEVGLLHIKLDQQNEMKKKNNELEESLTICKSQLDSMKKLDTSRNMALESYKVEKESLDAKLNAKQENIKTLQDQLTETKKELENLKLSYSAPSEKEREHLNLQPGANTEKENDALKQSEKAVRETNGIDEIEKKGEEIKDNVILGYEKEHKMKGLDTTNKIDGSDT